MTEQNSLFLETLARARRGEVDAFESLVARASEVLLPYCSLRLGARLRGEAEPADLVQETVIQAWSSLERLECDDERAFHRWLFRIAENRIRDLNDRATAVKRTPPGARLVDSGIFDRLRASLTGPLTAAVNGEQDERLRTALGELPAEEQAAVLSYYFLGTTIAELAKELDTSETSTRRLLGKALRRLGTQLGAE